MSEVPVAAAVQNARREKMEGRATEEEKRALLQRRLAWLDFMDSVDPPILTERRGVYVDRETFESDGVIGGGVE